MRASFAEDASNLGTEAVVSVSGGHVSDCRRLGGGAGLSSHGLFNGERRRREPRRTCSKPHALRALDANGTHCSSSVVLLAHLSLMKRMSMIRAKQMTATRGVLIKGLDRSTRLAQAYPARPVRIVVGAAAGGSIDILVPEFTSTRRQSGQD